MDDAVYLVDEQIAIHPANPFSCVPFPYRLHLTAVEVEPVFDTLSNNSRKAPGISLFNFRPQKTQRDP
jgi:hypothetical protein